MANLKETTEFLDAVFGTVGEGVRSFNDGAQVTDLVNFFDEALLWQQGIKGFAENFPKEAATATVVSVDELFAGYQTKLTTSGMDPILAAAIVTHTKGIYLTYVAIKRGNQEETDASATTELA